MGTAGQKSNLHICQRRTGQYPQMCLLFQMCQNKPLPISVKLIFTACACKAQPAPRLPRLQQKVYLRIMAQGFIMSYAHHRFCNGLLIDNMPLPKLHFQPETFFHLHFQDFHLHFPHNPHMNRRRYCLLCRPSFLPYHMQLRLFFFKFAKLPQYFHLIGSFRKHQRISQHRQKHRKFIFALPSQPLPRIGSAKPGDGTDTPRPHLLHRVKSGSPSGQSSVNPDLVRLFFPDFLLRRGTAPVVQQHLYPQDTPCHF